MKRPLTLSIGVTRAIFRLSEIPKGLKLPVRPAETKLDIFAPICDQYFHRNGCYSKFLMRNLSLM